MRINQINRITRLHNQSHVLLPNMDYEAIGRTDDGLYIFAVLPSYLDEFDIAIGNTKS